MFQNKKLIVIGVGLLAIALAGGGFWLIQNSKPAAVSYGATSGTVASSQIAASPSSGATSLGVSAGNASSLGQLNGNTNQSAAGSTGSTSSSKGPDPSTFKDYDKYKDSPGALFGEIQAGNGVELTANKKAAVYYKGYLTDGTIFDQTKAGSDGKLQPFVFTLGANQVIPGWEQGLAGMKAGGSRLVIVPPAVGYGAAGQGPVPPNAVLVFEVQLLAVQ